MSKGNTMCAQAQGLWLAAYLDGRMPIESSPDQILWDATLTSQFQKWRRGGGISPDLVFETLPYFDSLMKDLGLKVHRKKNMLTEWTQAYGPEDYQTLIQEWKDNNAKEDRSRPK